MLPIIQSLWIGDPLSNLEKLCIRSFLDNGHDFHLYVYDDVQGVPAGATVKDANKILPSREIFYTRGKYVGPFSDWFRYALISKRGGVWVDMDTICIKPFDFKEEIVFGYTELLCASIGVLKFPKNHFLMSALESFCRDHTEVQPWDSAADQKRKAHRSFQRQKEKISYQAFGTHAFDKAVRHYGLEKYGKPYMYFYSLNHGNAKTLFDDSFRDGIGLYPTTHSLHISNKVLGKSGIDKNSNFSGHSLFEQLKRKHGVAPVQNAPTFGVKQVQALFIKRAKEQDKRRNRQARKYKKWAIAFLAIGALLGFLVGYWV